MGRAGQDNPSKKIKPELRLLHPPPSPPARGKKQLMLENNPTLKQEVQLVGVKLVIDSK